MINKNLAICAFFACTCFTNLYAAEDSAKPSQPQAATSPQTMVPADKQQQPQSQSANRPEDQPPAKPSMVDYCREHTC